MIKRIRGTGPYHLVNLTRKHSSTVVRGMPSSNLITESEAQGIRSLVIMRIHD